MTPQWKRPVIALLLATSLAACGSGGGTSSAAATPDVACSAPKLVGDEANGTTVHLCVGQTLRLSLHSTYWQDIMSTPDSVLQTSGPTQAVTPSMGSCVPGGGCGTLITEFQGVAAGTAMVSAHRTTCGEALMCQPDQRAFSLTVVVG